MIVCQYLVCHNQEATLSDSGLTVGSQTHCQYPFLLSGPPVALSEAVFRLAQTPSLVWVIVVLTLVFRMYVFSSTVLEPRVVKMCGACVYKGTYKLRLQAWCDQSAVCLVQTPVTPSSSYT